MSGMQNVLPVYVTTDPNAPAQNIVPQYVTDGLPNTFLVGPGMLYETISAAIARAVAAGASVGVAGTAKSVITIDELYPADTIRLTVDDVQHLYTVPEGKWTAAQLAAVINADIGPGGSGQVVAVETSAVTEVTVTAFAASTLTSVVVSSGAHSVDTSGVAAIPRKGAQIIGMPGVDRPTAAEWQDAEAHNIGITYLEDSPEPSPRNYVAYKGERELSHAGELLPWPGAFALRLDDGWNWPMLATSAETNVFDGLSFAAYCQRIGMPLTFAIITDWIGTTNYFTRAQLQALQMMGHELCSHIMGNALPASQEDAARQLAQSIIDLEGIGGASPLPIPIKGLAMPGSWTHVAGYDLGTAVLIDSELGRAARRTYEWVQNVGTGMSHFAQQERYFSELAGLTAASTGITDLTSAKAFLQGICTPGCKVGVISHTASASGSGKEWTYVQIKAVVDAAVWLRQQGTSAPVTVSRMMSCNLGAAVWDGTSLHKAVLGGAVRDGGFEYRAIGTDAVDFGWAKLAVAGGDSCVASTDTPNAVFGGSKCCKIIRGAAGTILLAQYLSLQPGRSYLIRMAAQATEAGKKLTVKLTGYGDSQVPDITVSDAWADYEMLVGVAQATSLGFLEIWPGVSTTLYIDDVQICAV